MLTRDAFILLFIGGVIVLGSCDSVPDQAAQADNAEFIKGIKLSDLKETTPDGLDQDANLTFQILTLVINPESVDQLKGVCDGLSQKNIRFADQEAFAANGIQAAAGPYQKGVEAIRNLQQVGATLQAQLNATISQNSTESISHVSVNGRETILYSTSETGLGSSELEDGYLGWIITSHADPKQPGIVQVKLEPAFWQTGLEDLRFRINKDPYEYYKFNHARILARMNAGDVLILAPNRKVPAQETLDKYLFYIPGRRGKMKIFVIVCQNPGIL
jgi:hypothetical protein